MQSCERYGGFFSIATPEIRFFDLTAISLDGKFFVKIDTDIPSELSERIFPEVPQAQCKEVVDACLTAIMSDIEEGRGDELAQLLVPPLGGALLCHAEYIKRHHVMDARERIGAVMFPGVEISGHTLMVKVLPDLGDRIITADENNRWLV